MITIHPPARADQGDLVRYLIDLAGGDKTKVRSGRGGFTVPDDVALAYLTEIRHVAPPAPVPLPGSLTRIAVAAEDRGGLRQQKPAEPAADQAPQQQTTTTRPRRRTVAVPAPEEQSP